MHSNCILDPAVTLFIHHMVFVENVQKSPIAAHLKGLDPSSSAVRLQLSQAQKVEKMSVHISLNS